MDHVTLKPKVMVLKIQLCNHIFHILNILK